MHIIGRGAEAVLLHDGEKLIKRRLEKPYRLKELDEKLRKFRTKREAKMLQKASSLIPVPQVLDVSESKKEIVMEWIQGERVSDVLETLTERERKVLCRLLGEQIARLHNANIIHGDLTTANFLLKEEELFFIDFGLSFTSHKVEDRAVDVHVLKQALHSKHYRHWEDSFKEVVKGYRRSVVFKEVMRRLEKVEGRGRYKGKGLKRELKSPQPT